MTLLTRCELATAMTETVTGSDTQNQLMRWNMSERFSYGVEVGMRIMERRAINGDPTESLRKVLETPAE